VFEKTLFLITYDEHGGFYDPRAAEARRCAKRYVGESKFDFNLSGVRVPAVASPH
jgi:phospholipase C